MTEKRQTFENIKCLALLFDLIFFFYHTNLRWNTERLCGKAQSIPVHFTVQRAAALGCLTGNQLFLPQLLCPKGNDMAMTAAANGVLGDCKLGGKGARYGIIFLAPCGNMLQQTIQRHQLCLIGCQCGDGICIFCHTEAGHAPSMPL